MVKGVKAFGKDLICRGFQFKENEVFEVEGAPRACNKGFHFCENPLDTLDYYPLIGDDGNVTEFAEVEAVGEVDRDGNKVATNKIQIGAKLGLPGFIKASFDFLWEKCWSDPQAITNEKGDSEGNHAQLASSGDGAQLASSGDGARLASSGYGAQLASSGYGAQLASSGDGAQLASSGYGAQLASSGDSAQLDLQGDYSVGAAIGRGDNRIKGKVGSWITLAEWVWDGELGKDKPVCVKSAQIDGEILKADTWYMLRDGEFVALEL